jgi:hypothetical protein
MFPEFSPLAWSSKFNEYLSKLMPFISPMPTSSNKAATIKLAVASPASPMSDDIACILPTVVLGNLPNHDCEGPIKTASD